MLSPGYFLQSVLTLSIFFIAVGFIKAQRQTGSASYSLNSSLCNVKEWGEKWYKNFRNKKFNLNIIAIIFCICLTPSLTLANTTSTWPKTPYKPICADEVRNLIFYTNGDAVCILDKDTLNRRSVIRITQNHGDYGFEGVNSIFYYENKLYIALGYQGLQVTDVSNPDVPGESRFYITEDYITTGNYGNNVYASDVFVDGENVYIADFFYGIRVVKHDLTIDTENVGFKNSGQFRITINNGYAYVLNQFGGMGIVNNLGKAGQELLGAIPIAGAYMGYSGVRDIQISGDYAYLSNIQLGAVHVVDISTPNMEELPEVASYSSENKPQGLYASGDRLYMTDTKSMMEVLDITDPKRISRLDSVAGYGGHGVYASGNMVYFADYEHGLRRIDASSLTTTHTFPTPVCSEKVFVKGKNGFSVNSGADSEGLKIYNLQDENGITLQSFVATPGQAKDIYVYGFFGYIADGAEGLQMIDLSLPEHPGSLINIPTGGDASGVHVVGGYAYVATGANLKIVDVSDPSSPSVVSTITTGGDTRNVFVYEDYVYIADGSHGLKIADISNPVSPGTPVALDTSGVANDIYVKGNYAYVADESGGLQIIRPFSGAVLSPSLVKTYSTAGDATGITGIEDALYIAMNEKGYEVVNVTDPENPRQSRYIETNGSVSGIYISGERGLLARKSEGISFFTPYEMMDYPEPADWSGDSDKGCFTAVIASSNYNVNFLCLCLALVFLFFLFSILMYLERSNSGKRFY